MVELDEWMSFMYQENIRFRHLRKAVGKVSIHWLTFFLLLM